MRNFVVFFLMKLTISVSGGVLQKYSIQSDTSIASIVSSTLWLIQCYNKSDKTSCLVECNLKQRCILAQVLLDFQVKVQVNGLICT